MSDLADGFLAFALNASLLILSAAFLITVGRVVVGPTLPDRVLALDALVSIAIGFIAAIGIATGFALYVDIAIALGLVGFLATVALARFTFVRGKTDEDVAEERRQARREAGRHGGGAATGRGGTAP